MYRKCLSSKARHLGLKIGRVSRISCYEMKNPKNARAPTSDDFGEELAGEDGAFSVATCRRLDGSKSGNDKYRVEEEKHFSVQ